MRMKRKRSGAVFMIGIGQVLGLTFVYTYRQLKPKIWLRPLVNTTPGKISILILEANKNQTPNTRDE